jgi:acetyl/propionyl-CoA carboxylase alpha subunit
MDKISIGSNTYEAKLRRTDSEFKLTIGEDIYEGEFSRKNNGMVQLFMEDNRLIGFSERNGNEIYVHINGINYFIKRESGTVKDTSFEEESDDTVLSPITGKLLDKKVKNGDSVRKGEVVVILEAMKMEHRLKAPRDGTLSKLTSAEIGGQIKEGELMFELED